MIKTLKIKNFALIKDIVLNFNKGFNVIFGETGSGKSLILKAINFVLGEKVNKSYLPTEGNKLNVEIVCEEYNNQISKLLSDYSIDDEGLLIINRTLDDKGKSEIRLNGNIITQNMLKNITKSLIDCYAQHDSIALLNPSNHLSILDSYKCEENSDLLRELSKFLKDYKEVELKINELGGDYEQRIRTIDLLNYQINEIESANLKPEEDSNLEKQLELSRNAEKIKTKLQEINGYTITSDMRNCIKTLEQLENFGDEYKKSCERLNNTYYEVMDIFSDLQETERNIAFSEFEIEQIDARLDLIKSLKKKYGQSIEDILNFVEKAQQQKESLEKAEETIQILQSKKQGIFAMMEMICFQISENRKKMANDFTQAIEKELAYLGMKQSKFHIQFEKTEISSTGYDKIEFMFSANRGQDLKPIGKVISGGEMSRFMLALKNITANNDNINTLIFDEIDSGISGVIGSAIAERIAILSKEYQVLCITHLPQVCAMADAYFNVFKYVENNQTITHVKTLKDDEIFVGIAKLSGGDYKSQTSIKHAIELKTWANNFKKNIIIE